MFRLRLLDGTSRLRNPGAPVRHHGGAIGVDLGLEHLVTLDRPVPGLTDEHGHVPNPRVLERHLSRRLAGGFDLVCIEDLNVAGMAARKGLRNGRSVAEASMDELVRQLDDKTNDRRATLVKVGRFYPSSQTCSPCGARTKLALWQRVYHCTTSGLTLDRDVNAARNIAAEGQRPMREQHDQNQQHVASIRGETSNGEPRSGETEPAQLACAAGHRSSEAATVPASPPRADSRDLKVPAA